MSAQAPTQAAPSAPSAYGENSGLPGSARAERYVDDVVNGRQIAGEYAKAACLRHVEDRERGRWEFSRARADHVVKFAELLPNIKGRYARVDPKTGNTQQIELLDWQCFFLCSLFGWRDSEGLRRYREAYLSVARKNGKTLLAVVAGMYSFLLEKQIGGEFYSIAGDEKQAGVSWHMARDLITSSPHLKKKLGLITPLTAARTGVIQYPELGAKWQSLPKEIYSGSLDGRNATFVLADEVHSWRGNAGDTVAALKFAQEGQADPMFLCVTTSGVGLGEWWHETEVKYLQPMVTTQAAGGDRAKLDPDRVFYLGYHVDKSDIDGSDDVDPAAWPKANPSLGVVQTVDSMRADAMQADAMPAKRTLFHVKRLNRWLSGSSTWFDIEAYRERTVKPPGAAFYHEYDCYIGLAPVYSHGVAAMAFLFKKPDDSVYRLRVEYWIPLGRLNPGGYDYEHCALPLMLPLVKQQPRDAAHFIPGSVIPFDVLSERMRSAAVDYDIRAIGYERGSHDGALDADMEQLASEGFVITRRRSVDMTPQIQQFATLLSEGRLLAEQNTVFEQQLAHTGLRSDKGGTRQRLEPAPGRHQWAMTTGPRAVLHALAATTAKLKPKFAPMDLTID